MKAWVIGRTIREAREAIASARANGVEADFFEAIVPEQVALQERTFTEIRWNHPETGERVIGGLRFHAYSGDHLKRKACFWSHFHLWRRCVMDDQPKLIMESDAVFTRPFHPAEIDEDHAETFGMISLNDPRGATRKADDYHTQLAKRTEHLRVCQVPWIDARDVPQGLPGHSAYVLQPWFAAELIEGIKLRGAMPNDATACRQFFPGKLGCLTSYATKVSGRPSTLR